MWAQLPPPPWVGAPLAQTLCTVGGFSKTRDNLSSCRVVYDVLMQNSEVLPFHPSSLELPDSCPDDPQAQAQVRSAQMTLRLRLR